MSGTMKKEWDPEKWDGDIWIDAFEEEGDHTQKEVKDPGNRSWWEPGVYTKLDSEDLK